MAGIQDYAGEQLSEDGSTMFFCILLPTTLSVVMITYQDLFAQVCSVAVVLFLVVGLLFLDVVYSVITLCDRLRSILNLIVSIYIALFIRLKYYKAELYFCGF